MDSSNLRLGESTVPKGGKLEFIQLVIGQTGNVYGEENMLIHYIPVYDTPFQLHIFWPSGTERRSKLTFSESISLSLKTRLMTLLNMTQETSNFPAYLHLKMELLL